MNNIKIFRIFGILTLISLYFLILVGGVVRATGSGMGCPDWPKCFGHYIPPSDISEVRFHKVTPYAKRVFIIHEDKLYYSKKAFISSGSFDPADWQVFEDHGYAEFNATHTWIEALNRYVGVFVGLFVLGLFVYAYMLYKKRKELPSDYDYATILKYSLFAFVFVVIQGIIGKYLVQTNLKIKMLTVHMLFSYTVLFAVIYVLYNTSKSVFKITFHKQIHTLIVIAIILTAIQTVLGTQVTANVEMLLKLRYERGQLVDQFNTWFYVHRSFSIILLVFNFYLVYKIRIVEAHNTVKTIAVISLALIITEAFWGVVLNYFGYPHWVQPLHLLWGTLIAGIQFYLYIIYQKQKTVLRSA